MEKGRKGGRTEEKGAKGVKMGGDEREFIATKQAPTQGLWKGSIALAFAKSDYDLLTGQACGSEVE